MKCTAILALLSAAPIALAEPIPAAAPASPGPVAGEGFQARSCTPSPGCWCNKVQGQFCGNPSVNPDCLAGHVYECNENTGRTCDYGVRESCVQCGQLSC